MADNKEDELVSAYSLTVEHVVNAVKYSRADNATEILIDIHHILASEAARVVKKNAEFVSDLNPAAATPRERIVNPVAGLPPATQSAYIELNSALSAATDELMTRLQARLAPLTNTITPLTEIKAIIFAEFERNGILNVTYRNGTVMPLVKYAQTVAYSARTETDNLATINKAIADGSDYVYMPPSVNACPVCGSKSDRVYCVSGKDSRFPKVWGDLFEGQYATIHPNCKDRLVVWWEEQYTGDEKERLLRKSQRPFMDRQGKPLDAQSETARLQYIKQQEYNRMVWNEAKEWADIKVMPGLPWKTIGAFRRAKRAGADTYKEWVKQNAD